LHGDEAVAYHTRRVTGVVVASLEIPAADIAAACGRVEPELVSALKTAAERIRAFHQACKVALVYGHR
jgi:histidinol dehydrogenase